MYSRSPVRMSGRRSEKATRVYVGNLPRNVTRHEIEDLFQPFGQILNCDFKRTISGTPFAFVEFEDERDAEDAIKARDGHSLGGNKLRVELPFSGRKGLNKRRGERGPPQRGEYRVEISCLPRSGSWQDLKDHMRDAGPCVYADVYGDGTGVMEFTRRQHMECAVRYFDGTKFRSHEGETSRIEVRMLPTNGYGSGGDRSRSYGYEREGRGYDREVDGGRDAYRGRTDVRGNGGGSYRSPSGGRRYYGSVSRSRSMRR